MRCSLNLTAFVALFLLILTFPVSADTVKLDSGKTIEGRVVSETSVTVQIAVGGATLTIPRGKVVSISKADVAPSSGPATLEQLQTLETKGLWPELYEAATGVLARETSNTVALEKQKLASDRIREAFGWKKITELVRDRKLDEAITTLTERLRAWCGRCRAAGAGGTLCRPSAIPDAQFARPPHDSERGPQSARTRSLDARSGLRRGYRPDEPSQFRPGGHIA